MNKFEAKITATKDNGDGTATYKVEAQGYASTEDASKFNKFDIVVNTKDHTIVSVTPTEVVDTEYVGDKILNEAFLSQFKEQKLSDNIEVEVNDAVTGAMFSSKSTVRAVEEVRKALGY